MKKITLELDELDYNALLRAMSIRQQSRCMPDGDGNMAGRVIAEICRGWLEFMGKSVMSDAEDEDDEEDWGLNQ